MARRCPTRALDAGALEAVARALQSGERPAAGDPRRARAGASGLELAGRIGGKTGCRLGAQFFSARIERGAGRVALERIPYFVDPAIEFLKGYRHIVTIETGEPVAFFSYPDKPSLLKAPGCAGACRWRARR